MLAMLAELPHDSARKRQRTSGFARTRRITPYVAKGTIGNSNSLEFRRIPSCCKHSRKRTRRRGHPFRRRSYDQIFEGGAFCGCLGPWIPKD